MYQGQKETKYPEVPMDPSAPKDHLQPFRHCKNDTKADNVFQWELELLSNTGIFGEVTTQRDS